MLDRAVSSQAPPAPSPALRTGRLWASRCVQARPHGDDFFHGLGHSVGLDVHDPEDLSQPMPAGVVLTIEPGIYLSGRFGVRIEDDFLVTARGYEHLSSGLPRTIDAVEAAVGRA